MNRTTIFSENEICMRIFLNLFMNLLIKYLFFFQIFFFLLVKPESKEVINTNHFYIVNGINKNTNSRCFAFICREDCKNDLKDFLPPWIFRDMKNRVEDNFILTYSASLLKEKVIYYLLYPSFGQKFDEFYSSKTSEIKKGITIEFDVFSY